MCTLLSLLAALALPLAACSENETVLPKGKRILAVKVNVGRSGDFDAAFAESLEVGSEAQVIPLDWQDLETSPGRYAPEPNFLAIADLYYAAHPVALHVAIRPVHTNRKVVPPDLQHLPLSHPRVIERFRRLLDWMARQLPRITPRTLVIGAEVDVFAWGDPGRWQEWIDFYAGVTPHARTAFPGTLISSETTHHALEGRDLEWVRALHRHSDVVGISYYPMRPGLAAAEPPESVHDDFARAVSAVAGKPLVYYQIGYPSSAALGSSPARQADFVTHAFRAWDEHADRIHMLNVQWMHEAPAFGVDEFARYYRNDDERFRAFLGSIALKSWDGRAKPAWERLRAEARARGFGIAE